MADEQKTLTDTPEDPKRVGFTQCAEFFSKADLVDHLKAHGRRMSGQSRNANIPTWRAQGALSNVNATKSLLAEVNKRSEADLRAKPVDVDKEIGRLMALDNKDFDAEE